MRINSLTVRNFKGFEEREFLFHPEFNLVVGENGRGKSSLLEALAIAAGSWFLGIRGYDSRHIRAEDVRLEGFPASDESFHWERRFPCIVEARGSIRDQSVAWRRSLNGPEGRTTSAEARSIRDLAVDTDEIVRSGAKVLLPLISYYGTGRLWNVPRGEAQVRITKSSLTDRPSRLDGYRNSVDPRLSVSEFSTWFARESWVTFQQEGRAPTVFEAVRSALEKNVLGARRVSFDARLGEVVVDFGEQGRQPFNNLSDGQRCMLALVADIAQKAATLNPHLAEGVLTETPGLVLIDELDLHLHPKWQRHVIENLRTTFPAIQFVATTHSPFLIQSLRSGDELVMLDGQPTAEVENLSIEEIAQGIQGVRNPRVGARYEEMKGVARHYLETLEEATRAPEDKLEEYKARLAGALAPYADNPAFQAFLEMKRAAKLGE